jgi:hypothetical protein
MEGYRFEAPRVEIAIARGDLAAVEEVLEAWRPDGLWDIDGVVAWLNGLIALGRREDIEREAAEWRRPGTCIDPFVVRALGFARREDAMVEEAARIFDEIGLHWHAADTRRLLPST